VNFIQEAKAKKIRVILGDLPIEVFALFQFSIFYYEIIGPGCLWYY